MNNESVWFTAYLLNYNKGVNAPTILSAILVNDQTGSIAIEQKFEITNGLSFGHTIIPDSIPPGDYSFITYTNILAHGFPKDVFVQPITVKTAEETPFDVSLKLIDSVKANNAKHVVLKVETKGHIPVKDVAAIWELGLINNKISSGTIRTNADGKYLFSIPDSQIEPGKNFLNVQVTYKNEVRNVKMLLPVNDKQLHIGFYPEGGNLIDGVVSTVGWEAKTVYGRPVNVNAVLYEDNHVVDTIHTDSYGMGRFRFMPRLGNKYEVKVIGIPGDGYTLPRVLQDGVVVTVQRAVSDDSLQLKLISKYPGKFRVLIHNFQQVFYSFPVEAAAGGKKMLVNLGELPKGLSTITVLDSLQRPCAERLFFAHYNRRSMVSITADKAEYTTRDKVHIKLKLLLPETDSTKGIVTIACVQSNKIEAKKINDIESYFYLKQELGALPVKDKYMGQSTDDKDYLEKLLLIQGWRKYNWQNMTSNVMKDSTVHEKAIFLSGAVTRYGKPLKKTVELIAVTDSATKIITTDAKGNFYLNTGNGSVAEQKKIHLMLSDRTDGTYKIKMKDPFNIVNNILISGFKAVNYSISPMPVISSDSAAINGLNHVINLKEVNIAGQKEDIHNFQHINGIQQNECGDYVCIGNFLNCTKHYNDSRNQPPVIGKSYRSESGGNVVYKGCAGIHKGPSTISIDGITYAKEFYKSDYSVYNPPEPEYQSTIFWKHACYISSKEVTLEFYTSDLTGPFSIIVQGISSNDIIYEKKEFLVSKK